MAQPGQLRVDRSQHADCHHHHHGIYQPRKHAFAEQRGLFPGQREGQAQHQRDDHRQNHEGDQQQQAVGCAAGNASNSAGAASVEDISDPQMAAEEGATTARSRREGEVSWTQRRKQAFLRKYGRQRKEETTTPDVAVSAVVFAARLRNRVKAGAGGATATGSAEPAKGAGEAIAAPKPAGVPNKDVDAVAKGFGGVVLIE